MMFQGTLETKSDGKTLLSTFLADTPYGPIKVKASAPIPALGWGLNWAKKKVGDDIDFISGLFEPEDLCGEESCDLAYSIFEDLQSSNPTAKARAQRVLIKVRDRVKQGSIPARDVAYTLRRCAQAELESRKAEVMGSHEQILIPIGYDWRVIQKNLENAALTDPNVQLGRTIYNSIASKDATKRALGLRTFTRMCDRAADGDGDAAKTVWAVRQYAKLRSAREKNRKIEVLGFSWKKFSKKFKKKILKHERRFRAAVTKNKALVSMIPIYGPGIVTAAEVLNAVDNADGNASEQVQIITQLAAEGNPKAQEALASFQRAQTLRAQLQSQAAREQLIKRQALKQTQAWVPQYEGAQPPRGLVEAEMKKRAMEKLLARGQSPFDIKPYAAMETYQETIRERAPRYREARPPRRLVEAELRRRDMEEYEEISPEDLFDYESSYRDYEYEDYR